MSSVSGKVRNEAVRLFEELLDRLSGDEVEDFVAGAKVVAFQAVDGRLASMRHKTIEEVYEYLNSQSVATLKTMFKNPTPVGTGKKPWIDYALVALYGQTYDPPPKTNTSRSGRSTPRVPGSSTPKSKPVWNTAEIADLLKTMTSSAEAKAFLDVRGTIPQLKELSAMLKVSLTGISKKGKIIEAIVDRLIVAPRTYDRAQNG